MQRLGGRRVHDGQLVGVGCGILAPPSRKARDVRPNSSVNREVFMDHTHEYDCIVCGAHFDSSKDLATHNEQQHLRNATGMERPRTPESRRDEGEERDRADRT